MLNLTNIAAKHPERARIASDVSAYLAQGGTIETLDDTQTHKPMTFRDVNIAMGSEAAARRGNG